MEDLASGEIRKIEHAVYAIISLGREEMIPELIQALGRWGCQEMADTYLASGHAELAEAARDWAKKNGRALPSPESTLQASWGSWR